MSSKVNVTALANVRHNNKDFKPGDSIPGLSVEDTERLKGLGVVKVVEPLKPPADPPTDPPKDDPPKDDPPKDDPPKDPEKDDKKDKK